MLKTYSRMMTVAGPYKPQLQKTLRLSILASIIQGIIFALFFPLLLTLTAQPIDSRQVWILLVIFGLLVFIEGCIRWQELNFSWLTSSKVAHDTRLRLAKQLRQMPLQELNRRRAGDLNVIMSGNVSESVMWIGSLTTLVLQTIVTPLVIVLVTLFIDWRLALALLVSFPLAVPIYRYVRTLSKRILKAVSAADVETASRVVEYAQGLPVLRATKQVGVRSQHLQTALEHQRQVQARGQRLANLPLMTMATLVEVGLMVVIGLGVLFILQGSLSVVALFALVVIAMRFSEPLSLLVAYASVFDLMEIALERIETVMAIPPLPVQEPLAQPTRFDIEFDRVSFRYAEQTEWALQDVSFQLPVRSLTALVGPSGSGKTTITRLISRFADVQKGTIRLGGIDIQRMQPAELMRCISVVFQDVYLFDDTILNNIRMAKPDATNAEVEAAARIANCHEFITRLPNGYETRIGEIGSALSGGERQRISIARDILKDAPIVLLDEPTSALDTESEVAVQAAINRLVENKTVIVIAHRLSTVVGADLILVLADGQVIERGAHRELLAQQGRYAAMWAVQQQSQGWRIAA
ncbi:yersiniabactin-iron abc transporter permease atp-binding protein [Leptolyngbya sp. Heron Island J]|uniref:ABC transporter ATP-binding protein n=1 Tax=Leptolyngbya sp. Heron Island J TaxID=1385935 RepID=UPI0003B98820|nr:ABC transporter ATP-binding protein [Leptolyngbya sp. Heron Island J]ESA33399.1 yersiniabactin-iron abc transporter permease atp-binding protein [Leptolyngbya sp. Heron Island J]